ncbi:MAG: isocitrate lyase/PEP mutase family protein [Negativicutes bacterium]|nr:isocitrate lyase/PEP mutase family protein [Negativicutes bacterium]
MSETKAARLRRLLAGPDILILPGAYDALTAKLIEKAGFPAMVMGGYSIAAAKLGEPDVGYLSLTEMAAAVRTISDAVSIPLIADGDTGYGNALSVRRTVREYERAGAAAILLEDQLWPKRCGHMQGKQVIPAAEHALKIRAAVEARYDPDTLIMARTDARGVNGLDDAVERGKRYLAAGAEALFIEAPQNERELERIGREFPDAVLVANMIEGGRTPCLPAATLKQMGFKIVFWPCTALYTLAAAFDKVLACLKATGTTAACQNAMLDFDAFNALIGLPEYQKLEEKYRLTGGNANVHP